MTDGANLGAHRRPAALDQTSSPATSSPRSNSELQCPSSSHSSYAMDEIHLMGDEESHFDGSTYNEHQAIVRPIHSGKSSRTSSKRKIHSTRTSSKRKKYSTGAEQVDYRVDMGFSDDETPWNENEKMMKGRRGYVFTMAASSLVWTLSFVPYWTICCSHTALSIPKTWMDILHFGYIFLIITVVMVTAHSSQFKDAKLPDNAGFRLLQGVQLVVLLFLWAGTFVPQHVCRRVSYAVVWTCAIGALFIILFSWALVFQNKTVIECMNSPRQTMINCVKASCQMMIKCKKVLYDEKVQQRLPNLSLPGFIKAKFKKMLEKKSCSGEPMPLA